jgi:hypothetical protein
MTHNSGFDSWHGQEIFLFSIVSRPALRPTQPPMQWLLGALSLGIKQQRREADHSPPSITEVKNSTAITFTLLYVLMVWYLIA